MNHFSFLWGLNSQYPVAIQSYVGPFFRESPPYVESYSMMEKEE